MRIGVVWERKVDFPFKAGDPKDINSELLSHFEEDELLSGLRDAGHEVSGSDEDVFPPMSTYVEGLGFPFSRHFDAANLPDGLDLLVLGASAKLGGDGNPEVAEARRRHLAAPP